MGPQARLIDRLGDSMYGVAVSVFILVVGALFWSAFRRRPPADLNADHPERGVRLVVALATFTTFIILVIFVVTDFRASRAYVTIPAVDPVRIRVTGYQWWWDVQYLGARPQDRITTANEIHVPVGRPVVVSLRATDVIHSFWIPNLVGKRDLIPGDDNSLWFQADTPGIYRGVCAEYCGYQHANMAFQVVAEAPEVFSQWLTRQRDSASTPLDSRASRGRTVFLRSQCLLCHTIQGTLAGSRVGPDLTHVASRRTLAAGTIANTRANLTGWILDPQAIKPGTHMPATKLAADDLQALVAYLETLR
jgi:cytochrome c oxidase subunit 2